MDGLLKWIDDYGIENAVQRFHDEAVGAMGYGRPNEKAERRSYAFAGLVALWRKTWPPEMWPATLAGRLPAPPRDELMFLALGAAPKLADRVLTRDAELRLIWVTGPDQGADLRKCVASLQKALA
jgi:hypothetical protein